MQTLKLDIDDSIFDKVMFFLNNIPKSDIKIKEIQNTNSKNENNLVDFFQNSPLVDKVTLTREPEQYKQRVEF